MNERVEKNYPGMWGEQQALLQSFLMYQIPNIRRELERVEETILEITSRHNSYDKKEETLSIDCEECQEPFPPDEINGNDYCAECQEKINAEAGETQLEKAETEHMEEINNETKVA